MEKTKSESKPIKLFPRKATYNTKSGRPCARQRCLLQPAPQDPTRCTLYGGVDTHSSAFLNDVHTYSTKSLRWTVCPPKSEYIPQLRKGQSFTSLSPKTFPEASTRNIYLMFGGCAREEKELYNDAWLFYSAPTNRWVPLKFAEGSRTPIGRWFHMAADIQGGVVMYGGGGLDGRALEDDTVWLLKHMGNGIWIWKDCGKGPACRVDMGYVHMTNRQELIIQGGEITIRKEGKEPVYSSVNEVWIASTATDDIKFNKVTVNPGAGDEGNKLPRIFSHHLLQIGPRFALLWGGVLHWSNPHQSEGKAYHDVWFIDMSDMTSWRIPAVEGVRGLYSGACYLGRLGLIEYGSFQTDFSGKPRRHELRMRRYKVTERSLRKHVWRLKKKAGLIPAGETEEASDDDREEQEWSLLDDEGKYIERETKVPPRRQSLPRQAHSKPAATPTRHSLPKQAPARLSGSALTQRKRDMVQQARDGNGRLKEGTYIVGHVLQSNEIGHYVEIFVDGERYLGMLMSKKVQGSLEPNSKLNRDMESSLRQQMPVTESAFDRGQRERVTWAPEKKTPITSGAPQPSASQPNAPLQAGTGLAAQSQASGLNSAGTAAPMEIVSDSTKIATGSFTSAPADAKGAGFKMPDTSVPTPAAGVPNGAQGQTQTLAPQTSVGNQQKALEGNSVNGKRSFNAMEQTAEASKQSDEVGKRFKPFFEQQKELYERKLESQNAE